MISRKELFAEISNEAVCEDGEVVGYFVKNSRMNLLEQMLCSTVTVKLPTELELRCGEVCSECAANALQMVEDKLTAAGIKWEAE
ncbi:hypothetical protein ACI2JR_27140 [Klebsiella sp. NPDC088457]